MYLEKPCLIWHLHKTGEGYGHKTVNNKKYLAHRLAYCQANSISIESIKGLVVRHKCDNPSCVEPTHLELGTQADNVWDTSTRGRHARATPNAKLSPDEVRSIRKLYLEGVSNKQLSEQFKVSTGTIHFIVHNKIWKGLL